MFFLPIIYCSKKKKIKIKNKKKEKLGSLFCLRTPAYHTIPSLEVLLSWVEIVFEKFFLINYLIKFFVTSELRMNGLTKNRISMYIWSVYLA